MIAALNYEDLVGAFEDALVTKLRGHAAEAATSCTGLSRWRPRPSNTWMFFQVRRALRRKIRFSRSRILTCVLAIAMNRSGFAST